MENEANSIVVGSHVELELVNKAGKRERLAFDLVPDRSADFAAGRLSADTPLVRAILGQMPGGVVPYHAGDLVEVRILSVTTARDKSLPDAAAQRGAALERATSQADLANAISFALTFDSKWGGYDPEGIEKNWDKKSADNSSPESEDKHEE